MKSNLSMALVNERIRSDVYAGGGLLLLKAGTSLTSNHIRLLRKYGIKEVDIEKAMLRR